jgi:hypothetical protein
MRRNVHPSVWGPPAWSFLQSIAVACDDTSAEAYRAFLELLPEVLPCERCRAHSREYIAKNPVDTRNLAAWLRRFEERVSERKQQDVAQERCGGAKQRRSEEEEEEDEDEGAGMLTVLWILVLVAFVLLALRVGQKARVDGA